MSRISFNVKKKADKEIKDFLMNKKNFNTKLSNWTNMVMALCWDLRIVGSNPGRSLQVIFDPRLPQKNQQKIPSQNKLLVV